MSINGRLVYIIEILGFPLKPQPQNPFPSPIRASQPSGSVRRPAVGHWYGCCRESSMNQGSHGGGYSRSYGYHWISYMSLISHKILLLYLVYIIIIILLLLLIIYYYYYYYIYIIYAWFYLFLYIYANYIKLFCNISASEYDIWICSWHTQGVKQNQWDTIYIYTYSYNHTYNLIRPYTSIYDQWTWH